ncbi:MAG: RNA polymerase sigma factor [Lewinella sp.]
MTEKEEYFKQVYEQSKDKVYRLCLGFMGNTSDAEDLFQEVLIKIWNNLDKFRKDSNVNTWIYRIATNTALNYLKSKSREREHSRDFNSVELSSMPTESSSFDKEQKIRQLYQEIAGLKEIEKIIISLVLDNCSYSDIAEITGLSSSNVGVRINRIKKTLSKKLN